MKIIRQFWSKNLRLKAKYFKRKFTIKVTMNDVDLTETEKLIEHIKNMGYQK